ncbi:L10-interacting MYB domain-containing protein-like isoform X2 [Syzygium oleosum]|uniref:L10-interacting MYB domain-containing protein-like isoform X2 n=1 Tax=Syzygium oleosum TaxID=219896 RepID=UPI0024B8FD0B|nr:L10-interacting MYB domain-containing protein-like isoform X2 [Syzygium oleosum]
MESSKYTYMAKWTEPLTELFVSLMVDEVKKGNRTSCTYNIVGWINIEKEFNEQTRLHFSLPQFKNKAQKLKRQYGSFKKLLSTTGFGWDNDSKRVVVDDETVWANHIKANTEWVKFRKDRFPLYSQLCVVFGDTYATGEFAIGNAQGVAPSEGTGDSGGGGDNDVHVNLSEPELFFETQADVEQFNVSASPPPKSHILDRTPNAKRRRKSNSHSFDATCKAIQEMIKAKTPR